MVVEAGTPEAAEAGTPAAEAGTLAVAEVGTPAAEAEAAAPAAGIAVVVVAAVTRMAGNL